MRQSTYTRPHTFREAVQWLAENPGQYDYEVKIEGHRGSLMTRETWLESVADHSFIDYDGMGNEIDENGNVLGVVSAVRTANGDLEVFPDPGWIRPSEASRILPETKYILWYNK